MCGRYYIEIDEAEIRDIVIEAEKRAREANEQLKLKTSGEIFPTDIVPVQTGIGDYQPMKWGFPGFKGRPVINARSETVLEKPMFRAHMLARRCLIPASGYYEWKKEGSKKIKYKFYLSDEPLFFAGLWHELESPADKNERIVAADEANNARDIELMQTHTEEISAQDFLISKGTEEISAQDFCFPARQARRNASARTERYVIERDDEANNAGKQKDQPIKVFCILTTTSPPSILPIHDRMPVIIPSSRIEEWLTVNSNAMNESVKELIYRPVI